jgi:hypothetical protein
MLASFKMAIGGIYTPVALQKPTVATSYIGHNFSSFSSSSSNDFFQWTLFLEDQVFPKLKNSSGFS